MELTVVSAGSLKQLAILEVEYNNSIADVKEKLHNVHPKLYAARVSLRTEPKSKSIPDDSLVKELELVDRKIYCKDLGPQVSWTTVFLTEYAGPLVIYLIFYLRPSFIYGNGASLLERHPSVKLAMACHTFHYAKRLLETVFIHRFSKATMPIFNIFKNSGYYWGFAAWFAYFINHPKFTAAPDNVVLPAAVAFGVCELGNLSIHLALRALRPPGTRTRAIPRSTWNPFTWLFSLVSCPNYTYETGAWISFTIMTSCLPAGVFTLAGFYQMAVWALGKHRNYKKEFRDYPRQRRAIIPFLI